MNAILMIKLFAITAVFILSACVADGYAGDDVNYYEPYYEPSIGIYGTWGPDYRIGPYRRGDWDGARGGDHHNNAGPRGDGRGYHPAPAGRSPPSIPSAPRGHAPGGRPDGGARPDGGQPR